MSDVIVRPAALQDVATLLKFEQGVIETERAFDPTLKMDPINYYNLEELINSPEAELAVAESGNKVIGSGYARIKKSELFLKHEKFAYLGFMYVDPEYRGKGVNQKIIEFLKAWATSKQIDELRLEVYFGNSTAIKAYEKIGFSKHMIEMRMGIKNSK